MNNCFDITTMAGHGHSHGGCEHSSSDHSLDLGIQYSLYTKINLDHVQCLNEAVEGSGKTVFKPWEKRLDWEQFVESDVDEELLFNIPFTGNVKLKGIIVIGGEDETHPSQMRLFKNRPSLTFDDVSAEADQQFELSCDNAGIVEYATKVVKFCNVNSLSIHFPKNFGAETTKVYYIGLKGEFTEAVRQEIMLCSYEASPNPADHKIDAFNPVTQQIH